MDRRDELLDQHRRALLERYAQIFGAQWEAAPWGTPWSTVFAQAAEADKQYRDAEQILRDFARAGWTAIELLDAKGIDITQPPNADQAIGLTAPEVFLLSELLTPKASLRGALARVQQALDELAQPPGKKLTESDSVRTHLAAQRTGPIAPGFREYVDGNLRKGASRKMTRIELRTTTLEPMGTTIAPALVGPPPRAEQGDEWRRAYLVELLDTYPLKLDPANPAACQQPTDQQIAIVALLAGALEQMPTADLRQGIAHVINKERKAVALARRRRGVRGTIPEVDATRPPTRTSRPPKK